MASLLVARRRAEQVLDDSILERRRFGVSSRQGRFRFRERPVELRIPRRQKHNALVNRQSRRRVSAVPCILGQPQEDEEVRRRALERFLDVANRLLSPVGSPVGRKARRVPFRGDVPGPRRGGLLEGKDGGRSVARLLEPQALESEHAGVAPGQPERLVQELLRRNEVLSPHRRNGAIGPAERLSGSELSDRLETLACLREVAFLEGRESNILRGLENERVGGRRRNGCEKGKENGAYGERRMHPDAIILSLTEAERSARTHSWQRH